MEKLKAWTEEYMRIIGRYDGGRSYTWQEAKNDLDELLYSIYKERSKIHTAWISRLVTILMLEVKEERDRVWSLYR